MPASDGPDQSSKKEKGQRRKQSNSGACNIAKPQPKLKPTGMSKNLSWRSQKYVPIYMMTDTWPNFMRIKNMSFKQLFIGRVLGIPVLLWLVSALAVLRVTSIQWVSDDGYMYAAQASNIVTNFCFCFNAGEQVDASTGFIWCRDRH